VTDSLDAIFSWMVQDFSFRVDFCKYLMRFIIFLFFIFLDKKNFMSLQSGFIFWHFYVSWNNILKNAIYMFDPW